MKNIVFLFLSLFAAFSFFVNCKNETHLDKSPEKNYAEFCSSCHGQNMKAFVDRNWQYGNTKEDLIKSIRDGKKRNGMPAYKESLSTTEIEALAEYILTGIADRSIYDVQSEKTPKFYSTEKLKVQVDTVVENIGIPWGMKVTKDGTIYFTERSGTLKVKHPDGTITDIKNIPKVKNRNQGGMLDVVLHPNFEENQMLYLSYSKPTEGNYKPSTTVVIRGQLSDGALTNIEEIFVAQPFVNTHFHYGSRMVFDEDGYLFITVGDRGKRDEHPQFLSNACGKVHRIFEDGSIPPDNPFVDTEGAIASIWSYGHRNPQGLVIHPESKVIWEHEHGPKGGDELNKIEPGTNYGWPVISYGINYDGTTFTDKTEQEEMAQPINYWVPSIAPSGMAVVSGSQYPEWEGDILTGSLRFKYISRISIENDAVVEKEMIFRDIGRVRSIEMGADGFLYVGVEDPGRILKVVPVR